MALKHQVEYQEREQKKKALYLAAPVLGEEFPRVEELVVHLKFADPARKSMPSPYQRIFAPDMRLFFDFACPLRECTDGGFHLNSEIEKALTARSSERTGSATCKGKRKHAGGDCCGLELQYRIAVRSTEAPKRAARSGKSPQ